MKEEKFSGQKEELRKEWSRSKGMMLNQEGKEKKQEEEMMMRMTMKSTERPKLKEMSGRQEKGQEENGKNEWENDEPW